MVATEGNIHTQPETFMVLQVTHIAEVWRNPYKYGVVTQQLRMMSDCLDSAITLADDLQLQAMVERDEWLSDMPQLARLGACLAAPHYCQRIGSQYVKPAGVLEAAPQVELFRGQTSGQQVGHSPLMGSFASVVHRTPGRRGVGESHAREEKFTPLEAQPGASAGFSL